VVVRVSLWFGFLLQYRLDPRVALLLLACWLVFFGVLPWGVLSGGVVVVGGVWWSSV
jgi:hypothetical protein